MSPLAELPLVWQGATRLGVALDEEARQQFRVYADLLIRRGGITGATAVTDLEGVQRRHLLEAVSLFALLRSEALLNDDIAARVADLGSGGGLPGIPLAILARHSSVTLIEATGRKAGLLREAVRALDLGRVTVAAERAETLARLSPERAVYDLVVSRAVAVLPSLIELSLPFLRIGGVMAAIKGSRVEDELARCERALRLCGADEARVRPLRVPGGEKNLAVVLITKARATADTYPRRAGIPVKRPL